MRLADLVLAPIWCIRRTKSGPKRGTVPRMASGYSERHGTHCAINRGKKRCSGLRSCGYRAYFHDGTGKKIWNTKANSGLSVFPTIREAERWRTKMLAALHETGETPNASRLTLKQLWDDWYQGALTGKVRKANGEPYKRTTLAGYRTNFNRLLKDHAHKPVSRINAEWLELRCDEIYDRLEPSSANGTVSVVRAVFRDSSIRPNPAAGLTPYPDPGLREVEATSARKIDARLSALGDPDRALWAMAFLAGPRLAELQGLRMQDVDLVEAQAYVRRCDLPDYDGPDPDSIDLTGVGADDPRIEQVAYALGAVPDPANIRDQPFIRIRHVWDPHLKRLGPPKSQAAVRDIPLSEALEPYLHAHLGWKHDNGHATDPEAFLFTAEDGEGPIVASTIYRRARKAWRAVGLPQMTPHGARHWYGALALASGDPLYVVSSHLGHTDVNLTAKRYARILADGVARQSASNLTTYVLGAK